jgi:hypothetical protein
LFFGTPVGRPRKSIALRFHASRQPGAAVSGRPFDACVSLGCAIHAPPKPWVAIHGNPRNACVTPLEASGETFCAAALRKPVICLSWKVGMSSALAFTTMAL